MVLPRTVMGVELDLLPAAAFLAYNSGGHWAADKKEGNSVNS